MKIPMKKTKDEATPSGQRMEFSVSASDLIKQLASTWATRIGLWLTLRS